MKEHSASVTDGKQTVTVEVVDRITAIDPTDWNACAGGTFRGASPPNPFVSHEFLASLEQCGAVTAATGWFPQHLVLHDAAGAVVAVMPCYLKNHSSGEYVFDHGWADAYERAGGNYYPKLQVSVPFTPVTGPRLMARCGHEHAREGLLAAAIELARRHQASSVHWTFLNEPDRELLARHGMLQRTDQQFHWANDGYQDFDAFLASLASRKRKAISKERRDAIAADVEIVRLEGNDITETEWDAFYTFYMDTGSRKWGRPYLNRAFFSLIGQAMPDRLLLIMARRAGRWIAGALNFIGNDALFGRYWGCVEDHPFLHFELCYYQAIEYAIELGLPRVEAGAQGAHKLARGYLPITTHSAHYIASPGLRRAVSDYLERERAYVEEESRLLTAHAPFRRTP